MLQRLLVMVLFASGCLARYAPPRLDPKTPLTLELKGPSARVDVVLDARGIPHVFGQSEADLAFGLGFMHGRDRTFQVLVMKHAARGRLTELFGADALPLDQQLRVLSYRLAEAHAALSARDHTTLEAYARGVNAGAAHAGTPAELALLGVPFGEFTAEDSFAIMRLQSWSLSGDHRDELMRAQVLAKLPPGDARASLFDAPMWTGGVPIVGGAVAPQSAQPAASPGAHADGTNQGASVAAAAPPERTPAVAEGTNADRRERSQTTPLAAVTDPLHRERSQTTPLATATDPLHRERSQTPPLAAVTDPLRSQTPPTVTDPLQRDRSEPRAGTDAQTRAVASVAPLDRERRESLGAAYELPAAAAELAHQLGLDQLGASNSWAVHGSRTESGAPILCNDPHLSHELPSVFYLAHLEHPDFTGVGVTFAGIPAVLIGHTRSLAWGMTVSYADSQDLFRLQVTADGAGYVVDGVTVPFERLEQRFKLGSKADAEVKTETWLATRFGPVLPASTSTQHYALSWPALAVGGSNTEPISGFWDFLRAKNVDEATSAIERFQVAGQNVALAFTDGTIAYRLATYAPQRPEGVTGRVPRDGSRSVEAQLLKQTEKPALTNPAAGYLVAANQRVIADGDPHVGAVGTSGVPPHRARRIHQRLEALLGTKKATPDELLAIQQDVVSLEAQDLVPVLAAACPASTPRHEAEQVKAFCAALRSFDGTFSTDSLGALPFVATLTALRGQVVRSLGFEAASVKSVARSFPVTNAVHQALLAGGKSPLFGQGLEVMMTAAVDEALDDVIARTGKKPSDWRWGAVHTLQFKGVLARAPVVGGFFTGPITEQSGHGNTIRAESGLPVDHGAAMRMVVELSSPPRARFTIDTGQSGAPKEPHALDQFPAWTSGTPTPLPMTRAELDAEAEGAFVLLPAR